MMRFLANSESESFSAAANTAAPPLAVGAEISPDVCYCISMVAGFTEVENGARSLMVLKLSFKCSHWFQLYPGKQCWKMTDIQFTFSLWLSCKIWCTCNQLQMLHGSNSRSRCLSTFPNFKWPHLQLPAPHPCPFPPFQPLHLQIRLMWNDKCEIHYRLCYFCDAALVGNVITLMVW